MKDLGLLGRRPDLADTRSIVTGIVTAWPATPSVRLPPLTDIVKAYDTGRIGSRGLEGKRRVHPVKQHAFAAPQRQRIHQQVQLVDQVVRKQGVSLPPGACITPSSVTNSETMSFLMRPLPALPLQLPSQGCGRTGQACEDKAVTRVREETMSLLASMLALGLAPTEAGIEESTQRVKHLSARPVRLLLEACKKHSSEVAQMLAVAAFAPGGSSLEITDMHLALDAEQVRAALANANGGCL